MALNTEQQILELIKRSERPLICVPKGAGPDGYASALGLSKAMHKLDKKVEIVAQDGLTPKNLHFISGHDTVRPNIENLRQYVVELDAQKTKVKEMTYEMKNDKLFIYLSPKDGSWKQNDLVFNPSGYRFDVLITIGATDLESFAGLYDEHAEFFYDTPIVNIDHQPENEHFGQINLVDLNASACGEVCHELIEAIDPGLIDEEIATAFLAGMIAKTHSFKHANVTPKTLAVASRLVSVGAKRDQIVEQLYRTRSVNTLRLWGRALARLKVDEKHSMVWTLLSAQDFMHSGAEEEDLPDVIDELISSSPKSQVVILFFENRRKEVEVIVRTQKPINALELCSTMKAAGTADCVRCHFKDKPISQVENEVTQKILEKIGN